MKPVTEHVTRFLFLGDTSWQHRLCETLHPLRMGSSAALARSWIPKYMEWERMEGREVELFNSGASAIRQAIITPGK